MKLNPLPPQQEIKNALHYHTETGVFRWRFAQSRQKIQPWSIAGGPRKDGYVFIMINKVRYAAHRLAWKYVTGRDGDFEIDHADGNPSNNSFVNLREATHKQNMENRRNQSNNKSGVRGVSFCQTRKKWKAQIKSKGKSFFLGYFDEKEDAAKAYAIASTNLHTHFRIDLKGGAA
jgi:hypothetical protein